MTRFGLADYLDQSASDLPLGIRQRLSLAVAVVHEPEMLILDEPTSGVDPLARDRFWELLIDLSRNQGVTIFVSTHFMNEAERCDRIALMDSGRVLAIDTPVELIRGRHAANLEAAFISYLEEATGAGARPNAGDTNTARGSRARCSDRRGVSTCVRTIPVQPAPLLRHDDPGSVGTRTRPDPTGLRSVRNGAVDARVRVRHFDRRQQSIVRGP